MDPQKGHWPAREALYRDPSCLVAEDLSKALDELMSKPSRSLAQK